MALTLSSPEFASGEPIPPTFTCDGDNISPPLEWSGVPEGTQSLALILDDPDAADQRGGPFAHWVLCNIPVGIHGLAEDFQVDEIPDAGLVHGRNTFGNTFYEGPCPPRGASHRYYFRLYALDQPLAVSGGITRAQLIDRMKGHILENTELMVSYNRAG